MFEDFFRPKIESNSSSKFVTLPFWPGLRADCAKWFGRRQQEARKQKVRESEGMGKWAREVPQT